MKETEQPPARSSIPGIGSIPARVSTANSKTLQAIVKKVIRGCRVSRNLPVYFQHEELYEEVPVKQIENWGESLMTNQQESKMTFNLII